MQERTPYQRADMISTRLAELWNRGCGKLPGDPAITAYTRMYRRLEQKYPSQFPFLIRDAKRLMY